MDATFLPHTSSRCSHLHLLPPPYIPRWRSGYKSVCLCFGLLHAEYMLEEIRSSFFFFFFFLWLQRCSSSDIGNPEWISKHKTWVSKFAAGFTSVRYGRAVNLHFSETAEVTRKLHAKNPTAKNIKNPKYLFLRSPILSGIIIAAFLLLSPSVQYPWQPLIRQNERTEAYISLTLTPQPSQVGGCFYGFPFSSCQGYQPMLLPVQSEPLIL